MKTPEKNAVFLGGVYQKTGYANKKEKTIHETGYLIVTSRCTPLGGMDLNMYYPCFTPSSELVATEPKHNYAAALTSPGSPMKAVPTLGSGAMVSV